MDCLRCRRVPDDGKVLAYVVTLLLVASLRPTDQLSVGLVSAGCRLGCRRVGWTFVRVISSLGAGGVSTPARRIAVHSTASPRTPAVFQGVEFRNLLQWLYLRHFIPAFQPEI